MKKIYNPEMSSLFKIGEKKKQLNLKPILASKKRTVKIHQNKPGGRNKRLKV